MHFIEFSSLSECCSLGVGGPARFSTVVRSEADVELAVRWAKQRGLPLYVLGGGSNVVIADAGVDGLVVRMALSGLRIQAGPEYAELDVAAGEVWDTTVFSSVEQGLQGLECLSGIPGLVGATPLQNVGAYGQEVAETIDRVKVLDRHSLESRWLSNEECEFSYRDSVFKRQAKDRFIILRVVFRLRPGKPPKLSYPDLQRRAEALSGAPSLKQVRELVLRVRREKSMVLDAGDENRRSCGSFFLNPIVTRERFAELLAASPTPIPHYPQADGRIKLPAAWLIEHSGFARGHRDGNVGISSKHSLALVCHAQASARELVQLAARIRHQVHQRFGVELVPEPVFWGFDTGRSDPQDPLGQSAI